MVSAKLDAFRRRPQPHQRLTDRTVDVARTRIGMGAENRGDTFCEDRTEVALELRRARRAEPHIIVGAQQPSQGTRAV